MEIRLPGDRLRDLRLIDRSRLDAALARGEYAAVWMEDPDPRIAGLNLQTVYARHLRKGAPKPGFLFWEPKSR
jgi:hypothetical protein